MTDFIYFYFHEKINIKLFERLLRPKKSQNPLSILAKFNTKMVVQHLASVTEMSSVKFAHNVSHDTYPCCATVNLQQNVKNVFFRSPAPFRRFKKVDKDKRTA